MDDAHAPRLDGFTPLRLRLQPGDHVIDVTAPDVLLGRQSDAGLRMPQPDVSRQHCRFQFVEGGWRILDLNSMNGVYVNGVRVKQTAVIHAGDSIRICGIALEVELPGVETPVDGPSHALKGPHFAPEVTVHRQAS